ncbi:tetratricopeptide repeat protein [Streptomyces sp. MK37H]|uniref:ATP-binding protein n=1 Tax=Streptomyces sp. MK37H TaxID=2699117 RepID=UPI0027E46940|nr:tetratricopeptide repeat protein [Streptomyces sp. MK37H]
MLRLNQALPRNGDLNRLPVFMIAGTAGAGKTSLALHWAHNIQDRFPDGSLYVNLRGYDPGEPVSADEVLRQFLIALGTPPAAIPSSPESAAALYRSLLASRRMLLILDNAASTAQVRPLLPGNARNMTIVTSRGRLAGLSIRDGAHRLTLSTLAESAAVTLLRSVTDGFRSDDDEELSELARLCARLPLALRIAAERASSHPYMDLRELMEDLRDESALWDALSAGDEEEAEAVRAVFAWSYRALPPEAARMFRLLGLHPGPGISVDTAAALAGLSVRQTRQLLDVLVGAHLLEQKAPNRFEFHDLLRAYARNQVCQEDSAEERAEALRRILDWYLHTADAAQSWLRPDEDRLVTDQQPPDVRPLTFASYDQAVDWAELEQVNFFPSVQVAEKAGLDEIAALLSAILWNAKAPSSLTADWLPIGRVGLEAARRLGDRLLEARLHENFGFAHTKLNRLTDSISCHEKALKIRQESNDREGEATSLNALALVQLRKRHLSLAKEGLQRASIIFGELGETHWRAISLANLALVNHQAGNLVEAAEHLGEALSIHRSQKDKRSIGNALWILSSIHLECGDLQDSLSASEEAVKIALELRSHVLEGCWLIAAGHAQRALNQYGDALTSFQRSATLHRRLGDRSREALALQGAGDTYLRLERYDEAANFHRRAGAVHRELGDTWNEALALEGLGSALLSKGVEAACRHWVQALELLRNYDDPRAITTRERLRLRLSGTGKS